MRKYALLPVLLLLPTYLFASSEDVAPESLLAFVVVAGIYLLIVWNIINSATRADRILKAELTKIIFLKRLLQAKEINTDINPDELRALNNELKNIDLNKQAK